MDVTLHIPDEVAKGAGASLCANSSRTVRAWVENPPSWLEVRVAPVLDDPASQSLDDGERAAIALAVALTADLILIDGRAGVTVACAKRFAVTETLGLLDLAARRGLLKLRDAFARLRATNFRYPMEVMEALLAQEDGGQND
jgi:predicted nucleic acid-binding protein